MELILNCINHFEKYKNEVQVYCRTCQLECDRPTYNSTFAIGGVSCSADTFVQGGSSVLRINISGGKPAHRKSANR